jgi:hypothetical protein
MNRQLDVGAWIAGVGAVAVVAAVIAGYFSVASPGQARALRLDAQRLATMQRLAAAAQCAYTFTDRVPASIEEIRRDFLERRISVDGRCTSVQFTPGEAESVSYAADGAEHIILCGEFRRPSPRAPDAATPEPFNAFADFPEFQAPRAAAGRHCYRIRLVKLVPPSPAPPRSQAEPPG